MKRNVDLTEDGIFTTSSIDSHVRSLTTERMFFKEFGFAWWEALADIFDDSALLPIGDKEQRESYKIAQQVLSGDYCDRCGRKITRYYSNLNLSLCVQCCKELELYVYGRTPWNDMQDEREHRRHRSTFYDFIH